MRYELVQRGIEQTDGHAKSVHSFEDAFEVAALHGSSLARADGVLRRRKRESSRDSLDAVAFEEHMLRAAQTDAPERRNWRACLASRGESALVRTRVLVNLVGKIHDSAEVAVEFRVRWWAPDRRRLHRWNR